MSTERRKQVYQEHFRPVIPSSNLYNLNYKRDNQTKPKPNTLLLIENFVLLIRFLLLVCLFSNKKIKLDFFCFVKYY